METLKGFRTIIVAGVYLAYGVLAGLNWLPDPVEAAKLDQWADYIVLILTNPITVAIVMAIMRWQTDTPLGKKSGK